MSHKDKQRLKSYLISSKNITGSWEFSKTEYFCKYCGIDFKEVMKEAVIWQNQFGNGAELSDNSLAHTIL